MRFFWCDLHYACFGFISKDDVVIESPPIFKWAVGKKLKEIRPFLIEKKAIVKEIIIVNDGK